jgi:hypothetical protein
MEEEKTYALLLTEYEFKRIRALLLELKEDCRDYSWALNGYQKEVVECFEAMESAVKEALNILDKGYRRG